MRKLSTLVLMSLVGAISSAQLVQCVSSNIDTDSVSYSGTVTSWASASETVGNNAFSMGSQCYTDFDVSTGGNQTMTATQSFAAHIRVKWIGGSPPSTSTPYSAKFHTWGIRYLWSRSTLTFQPSVTRSIQLTTMCSGLYIPAPNSPSFLVTNGNLGEVGPLGTFSVLDDDYPVFEGEEGDWEFYGDEDSSCLFVLEGDGHYYGNVPVTNSFLQGGVYTASGTFFLNKDASFTRTEGRVYYELYELGGQAVS